MLVIGAIVALFSAATLAAGGAMLWADQTQRDSAGYVSVTEDLDTGAYALVAEDIDFRARDIPRALYPSSILDKARIQAASISGGPVFVGIARAADVDRYLGSTSYAMVTDFRGSSLISHAGGAPETSPADETFWVASSSGSGKQSLTWDVREGTWTAVVMNADASAGVSVETKVGARIPSLGWIAAGVMGVGLVFLLLGAGLIAWAVYRASRPRPETSPVS
jgi:hypothetical protein